MQPPNLANLFVAGGASFFFNPGTGERDLGLIEKPPDVEVKATEIPVYNSRSGKSRLKLLFTTKDEVNWTFSLQEAVAATMQAFFKGGPLSVVSPGTAQAVDQEMALPGGNLADVGQYGISAVTVRQFLDLCLQYSGGVFTNDSVQADLATGGTPFPLLTVAGDYVYFGKASVFQELYLALEVSGAYTTVVWQYWNGSAWTTLTASGAAVALGASGVVSFTPPADWAPTIVNNCPSPLYFIRCSCSAKTTVATCNRVRQNAVQNTDYIVDPGQAAASGLLPGRIGRLSAGLIADGEEVKVSFTYITWASIQFPVADSEYQEGSARIAFRPSGGFQWNYFIPRCQLKPNGKLTFDDTKTFEVPMILAVLDAFDIEPDYPMGYWECLNES